MGFFSCVNHHTNMDDHEIEILSAEDNPYDAGRAIHALRNHNLANKLVHLSDGAEALDLVFGASQYKDRNIGYARKVIFLDIKMPGVSALEVFQKIKADQRTKSIPIVMATPSAEDPDVKRSYELGASGYIVKPVAFENFAKTISKPGFSWRVINKT